MHLTEYERRIIVSYYDNVRPHVAKVIKNTTLQSLIKRRVTLNFALSDYLILTDTASPC